MFLLGCGMVWRIHWKVLECHIDQHGGSEHQVQNRWYTIGATPAKVRRGQWPGELMDHQPRD